MDYATAVRLAEAGDSVLWLVPPRPNRSIGGDLKLLEQAALDQGDPYEVNRTQMEIRFDGGGCVKLYTSAMVQRDAHRVFEWHSTNYPNHELIAPYVRLARNTTEQG